MDIERPMLVLEEGMDEPRCWALEEDLTTLGRWPDNDVVLPDRRVSRHHAQIRRIGTQFFLEDRNSTNGTYINGERISESSPLQDGDRLQFAPSFQLRFVDSASTSPVVGRPPRRQLEIDDLERRVTIGGEEVDLSVAQYNLLRLLKMHEGKVVSRPEIVRAVWSEEEEEGVTSQAIDALVRRLRERLGQVDPDHQYVQTVRGHGFKFENR
ncbi:MAG: FHA domain-containing protein [Chloroflexota bacterium]|nr:FHA domain-containing protein [Chloroflexota bacterium]